MKNQAPLCVAGAVVIALLVVALRHAAPAPGSAVLVIEALDASDSVRQELPAGGTLLGRVIVTLAKVGARLDASRDQLAVFRVDRDAKEFYDQAAPASREKFQWSLIHATQAPAAHRGTFPAKFWTQAAARAATSQGPVAIAYGGDADNDDLTAQATQELQAAAQRLGANPRVSDVSIFGANPKNWATLRAIFAPLGDRLHLYAPDQMNPAPFLERLAAARLNNAPPRSPVARQSG